MRVLLSLGCYGLSITFWIRGFVLLSRLAGQRVVPLAPGEKIQVFRRQPGEFTPEGERLRVQGLLAFAAALLFLALALWL